MRSGIWILLLTAPAALAKAPTPPIEHFEPVLFELEPNARYASTDLSKWEVFTRQGVQLNREVAVQFIGAERGMKLEGVGPATAKLSLYQGNDRSKWKPECASYEAVAYRGLYPGIDLVYRRRAGKLKGDFIVQPGADPSLIRFRFSGGRVSVAADRVEVRLARETLTERIPAVYEISASGGRTESATAHYRQYPDGSIGFAVTRQGSARPLVIDPDLTFSTFLAGTLLDQVTATTWSAFDSTLLATGWTESADLGGTPLASHGGIDAYYARFLVSGSRVTLSGLALFGGSGTDKATCLSLSPAGFVVIGGSTTSPNFPVSFPLANHTTLKGNSDGFLTQFYPSSTQILASTYVGGAGADSVNAVFMDINNTIYFGGTTTSTSGLPISAGAAQTAYKGGASDGFIGTMTMYIQIGYCTYLGGSGADTITGLTVLNGQVFVTGGTDSWDFPTTSGAFQATDQGGQDAFVTKFTSAGALAYSTYLGGSGGTVGSPEMGNAIAVDSAGEAFVTGITTSSNFPVTSGAAQSKWVSTYGEPDAFLAKFTATGALSFATYWGGSSWDQANAITLLPSGYVAIAGYTASTDFPTLNAIGSGLNSNSTYSGASNAGGYDAFVAVFSPAGALYWSTYLGGAGTDEITGITCNSIGEIWVGGLTGSFNFPLNGAVQSNITSSGYHGFVSRIGLPKPQFGVFRPSSGQFYMVNNSNWVPYVGVTTFTTLNWSAVSGSDAIPVVGDWDNTGRPRLGIFRKNTGAWYLDMNGDDLYTPGVDKMVTNFGAGYYPVVGDWDNTGKTRLGYFYGGVWFLDINGDNVFQSGTDWLKIFGPGGTPVVGDWTNTGRQRLGVFNGGLWYLDLNGNYDNSQGINAIAGASTDVPVFADWDNTGIKRIGNYRTSGYPIGWWFCDKNDDFRYTGWPTDYYFIHGGTGDLPVVGVRSH